MRSTRSKKWVDYFFLINTEEKNVMPRSTIYTVHYICDMSYALLVAGMKISINKMTHIENFKVYIRDPASK